MEKLIPRKTFLKQISFLSFGFLHFNFKAKSSNEKSTSLKANRLKINDLIAINAPGGAIFDKAEIPYFKKYLEDLGFQVLICQTLYTQNGHLSNSPEFRAKELNDLFKNPKVKGIIAMRGGSGTAQILPFLDYKIIQENPKVLMGYSDLTSLINAIYTKTNLISFHGPVGYSTWEGYSEKIFRNILLKYNSNKKYILSSILNEFYTINSGKAIGKLFGGNLSVLCSMLGTPYLPNFKNNILFLEEIKEEPYRIDRMFTQLKLSGILYQISGLILGIFKNCKAEEPKKSMTIKEVIKFHFKDLKIPIFYGARIGHIKDKWIVPIGIEAEMDADKGTIQFLESPVL